METDFPTSNGNAVSRPKERLLLDRISDWESLIVEARYSPRALADRCGYTVRHLERVILRRYGRKLGAFIAGIRMQKAYNLLVSGLTVKETALGLGFKQVSHFCRCFKRYFEATASSVLTNAGLPGHEGHPADPQLQLGLFESRRADQAKRGKRSSNARPSNQERKSAGLTE